MPPCGRGLGQLFQSMFPGWLTLPFCSRQACQAPELGDGMNAIIVLQRPLPAVLLAGCGKFDHAGLAAVFGQKLGDGSGSRVSGLVIMANSRRGEDRAQFRPATVSCPVGQELPPEFPSGKRRLFG